jgi:hypothetical protein
MELFHAVLTKSTPLIDYSPEKNTLFMKGESYPENAAKFYAPLFVWLDKALSSHEVSKLIVDIEILYFNSSSSKALMNLFQKLGLAASQGRDVIVYWRYHPENETALESGEEFKEDNPELTFELVSLE